MPDAGKRANYDPAISARASATWGSNWVPAQRLSSADTDLIRLRDVLGSLRERADAARAAA